jgi:tRNA modification GTPase
MNAGDRGVWWRMLTPGTHAGAIAMFWVHAGDATQLMQAAGELGLGSVGIGSVGLRPLLRIDEALVARVDAQSLLIMPHGGVASTRAIARAMQELFGDAAAEAEIADRAWAWFPEGRSEVEARAMLAMSRAPSRLAVDALLAQHDLWNRAGAASNAARDLIMRRLLVPPVVCAVGASNIGKSTLMNALAKRHVSIVADEPGTTRDHVGVLLDCAGLTVQYVDTPGVRETDDAEEIAARERALAIAERASLVVLCGDAAGEPARLATSAVRVMRVALRVDRAKPAWRADVCVSAATGEGLEALVLEMRERLLPSEILAQDVPWKFWE